ncbi:MAG: IS1634 family transposase, partial [Actinobacteria bacterium]|nr:IS1634 family transposase [Actinomycetota bacterium]
MHVVTNRRQGTHREYVTHLLRRSYREGGKVKNETLANLSHLPDGVIELVRGALAGRHYLDSEAAFAIERSLPAGHVQAALGMARRLELGRLLDRGRSRERDLCLAMICQQALAPGSKLAAVRALSQSTLGFELGVSDADEDDLYGALDWLFCRQARIEDRLAGRHLKDGELVLYDVSSSYFEGRSCPLAKLGYSRDGRRGTPQIIYGLLCDKPGRPVCVEVFSGELHDDKTLPAQVEKLKTRFGLKTVIVVADRGMVTKANLELMAETDGVGWITALKAPQIKKLVKTGALQLSLFDEHNLAEIEAPA